MWPNQQFPIESVTFIKKILNRKLDFLFNLLVHENKIIRTLFSLAFGSSHFGSSSAASIKRKLPSLSETLEKETKIAAAVI